MSAAGRLDTEVYERLKMPDGQVDKDTRSLTLAEARIPPPGNAPAPWPSPHGPNTQVWARLYPPSKPIFSRATCLWSPPPRGSRRLRVRLLLLLSRRHLTVLGAVQHREVQGQAQAQARLQRRARVSLMRLAEGRSGSLVGRWGWLG